MKSDEQSEEDGGGGSGGGRDEHWKGEIIRRKRRRGREGRESEQGEDAELRVNREQGRRVGRQLEEGRIILLEGEGRGMRKG